MTREEAKSTLRNTAWLGTDDERNNVEEAIEILTTDKGGETIYRQDAIEAIKNLPRWVMDANGEFQPVDPPTVSMLDPEDAVSAIENLPSAQPDNQTNLCDSCDYSYPDCPSKNDDVIFGSGIGNDNICACNKYKPSAQQWIPVTERLPEKSGLYLVTGGLRGTEVYLRYYNVNGDCGFWSGHPYAYDAVIAWMPLPEAYK